MKYLFLLLIPFFINGQQRIDSANEGELTDLMIEDVNTTYSQYRMDHPINQKYFQIDSSFIVYTIKELIRLKFKPFYGYSLKDIPVDSIKFYITDIFYNTNRKKLIGFLIYRLPKDSFSIKRYPNSNYYYNGLGIAGFKTLTDKIWKIYPLPNIKYIYNNEVGILTKKLKRYYFTKLQGNEEVIYTDDGYWDRIKINSNLKDSAFWDCPLWQPGLSVKGLYNFQTRLKSTNPIAYKERIYPKIIYPDSLVNHLK